MKFINEIFVARPPQVVFPFVGDINKIPLWNYAVIKNEKITLGTVGVGSIYKQQRNFLGRTLEDTFVIEEYEPDHKITIRSVEAEYPFIISYSFKPYANGTVILNSFELNGRFAEGLLGFFFKGKVKAAVAKNLEKLKELIEKG